MTLIKHVEALSDDDKEALQVFFESNESKTFNIDGKDIALSKA